MVRAFRTFVALLAVAGVTACTVSSTNPPPLAGPSELGLSLTLTATPDVLTQDGSAQARVVVLARDPNGQPRSGVGLRVEITQGGRIADYGSLSPGKNVSTAGDGTVTLFYTAPPAPLQSVDCGANIITLAVTPSGGDYGNATPRTVDIRLVPPGVILPPSDIVAGFTIAPATAGELDNVLFNASPCATDSSTDCTKGSVAGYSWDFGDGSKGTGMVATHQYNRAGTYAVTLTVTDSLGRAVSATKTCSITALAAPKAEFTFSPTAPAHGVLMYFNASTSTVAAGRTIVSYLWTWGDGSASEDPGPNEDHIYAAPGTYNVTLTIVDDGGRRNSVTKPVTVS